MSDQQKTDIQTLTGEVATAARNFFEPVFNGLLRPHDDTLLTRGGGSGLWIYDEIERDCHAYAVLQKRKMAVIARDWRIDSASKAPADQEAADGISEMLDNMEFDSACLKLLDAILKGFAVGEIMWQVSGNQVVPADIYGRDQRRFVMDEDYKARLLTLEHPVYGIEIPDRKFIVHRFGAKDNNPYGLGLGTRLFWPVLFKRQGLQFWLVYADKLGVPTVWGTYPSGATPVQKQALLDAMTAIAVDAGIAVPAGMDLKLLEAQKGAGAGGTYDTLIKLLNDEISEAVLGETMSTTAHHSGLGSSQANVQNEVRIELIKADADLLAATLNGTLIKWMCELNYPDAQPPKIWWDVSEPEDLKARADRDQVLANIGYRLSPETVKDVYGDGYVDLGPQPAKGTAPPPAAAGLSFAERPAGSPVAGTIADIESHSSTALRPLFDPILQLVERAESLEEIRDGLGRMYPSLDASRLSELMAEGMALARLKGRRDVQAEARDA